MKIPATNLWHWDSVDDRLELQFNNPAEIQALIDRSLKTRGGYLSFVIDLPKRPRSTGFKSQNHHLWGHAEQIGDHLGYDRREMLYLIAELTPGWPMAELKGKMIPRSESSISVEVSNAAIETAHRIAAENGIVLREAE